MKELIQHIPGVNVLLAAHSDNTQQRGYDICLPTRGVQNNEYTIDCIL